MHEGCHDTFIHQPARFKHVCDKYIICSTKPIIHQTVLTLMLKINILKLKWVLIKPKPDDLLIKRPGQNN
jgi:hypothetical protein